MGGELSSVEVTSTGHRRAGQADRGCAEGVFVAEEVDARGDRRDGLIADVEGEVLVGR